MKAFLRLKNTQAATLAIFQNLMPLMYSKEEGDHSRLVSMKSKLIIGQQVVRREVSQQKLFNVALQTLADDRQ